MYIKDYNSKMNSEMVICMIVFALFHRKIDNFELKRWAASVFGLFLTYFVMGGYTYQHIFLVVSSIVLIRAIGWRKCHIYVTSYIFGYIFLFRIFHLNVCYNKSVELCLHQMLCAIKLVGVAFDIHLSNRAKDKDDLLNKNEEPLNPTFMDLFHYIFSYTGMIMGPYIRYRTYDDFLKYPFSKSSDYRMILLKRIPVVYVCAVMTKLINNYFPIQYIITDEFRRSHFLFKNFLNFLYLLRFKLWMTSGIYMAQCLCALLGLGAYPSHLKSTSAHGPIEKYNHLKHISKSDADCLEYNFDTVSTMNFVKIHTTPWQSEFWRNWNLTVQYCMGRYFYMEVFGKPVFKDYRIILTMLVSAFWHGIEVGYYTSLVLCGVYLISEKPYQKIYQYTSGWTSVVYLTVMWFIHAHIFSHLMISFVILDPVAIRIHAAAMNYVPYISLLFFYLIGKLALTFVKKES